jgi:hypothetical protein
MPIEPLPRALRDYLAAFNVVALCVYADGRLGTSRNPRGAAAAWWVESNKAGPVLRVAKRDSGDIPAAAKALGVRLTEHSRVVARVSASVARIEAGMRWAQGTGTLGEFNRQYRQRRIEAARQGRRFMTYGQAKARLRKALVGVAAGEPVAIVRELFGGPVTLG